MPREQEEFQKAVDNILEAIMFENWLRFYFIREEAATDKEGEVLRIELPQKTVDKLKNLYPSLWPLAEMMMDRPVDFETSRRAILAFTMSRLEGQTMPRDMAQSIFSSRAFQIKLQLFHTWTSIHEDQLDRGFLDFDAWRKLFGEWLNGKGARELAEKLANSPDTAV